MLYYNLYSIVITEHFYVVRNSGLPITFFVSVADLVSLLIASPQCGVLLAENITVVPKVVRFTGITLRTCPVTFTNFLSICRVTGVLTGNFCTVYCTVPVVPSVNTVRTVRP